MQEVVKLETEYWTLVEIPKQEKQETVPAFVMRACSIMEKTQKSEQKTPQKLTEEAADKRERLERLDPMTISQIEHENTQMINDLYRLLKKYQGLRNLIRELKVSILINLLLATIDLCCSYSIMTTEKFYYIEVKTFIIDVN